MPGVHACMFMQSIEEVERDVLNGQKLQGTTTALEVHHFLKARNQTDEYVLTIDDMRALMRDDYHRFPLMASVYKVIYERADPDTVIQSLHNLEVVK